MNIFIYLYMTGHVHCYALFIGIYILCNSVMLNCRVLGFRRVPLTVGRVIDLEDDVLPVATERLRNTFFTNGELHSFVAYVYYL